MWLNQLPYTKYTSLKAEVPGNNHRIWNPLFQSSILQLYKMDNQMRDEDIFYSDDEFSDSEDLYQVGPEMYSVAMILIFRCPITTTPRRGGASTTSMEARRWLRTTGRTPSTTQSTRSPWAWPAWAWEATFSIMTGWVQIHILYNILASWLYLIWN